MKINPKKVERLLIAIRAVMKSQEWHSGLLLRECSPGRVKRTANAELKAALQSAVGGGRLTRQRVGQLLNRDMEGEQSPDANLKLEAKYDTERKLWLYRVAPIQTAAEIRAEGRALLRAVEADAQQRSDDFEAKLARKPLGRQIDMIGAQLTRMERAAAKEQKQEERAIASSERRELDTLLRRETNAEQTFREALITLGKADAELRAHIGRIRSEHDLDKRIELYKRETAAIKASGDYTRVRSEVLKWAKREQIQCSQDHLEGHIRTVFQIERMRGPAFRWLFWMSMNPDHFTPVSAPRIADLAESTLRDSIRLPGDWSPFKF